MEDPKKVYENLKQLLTELQKVKDLNNLANEYKTISANLVLSLQDYLNDSRAFSDAFNNYLSQTNKSTKETKEALDNAVRSMNSAISTLSIADGTLENNEKALNDRLNKLEKQAATIESLYNKCIAMEQKIREDTESIISKAAKDISTQNIILAGETKKEIQKGNQQIAVDVHNLSRELEQNNKSLTQYQDRLQNEHKEISSLVHTMYNALSGQITQSKEEYTQIAYNNERSRRESADMLLLQVKRSRRLQGVTVGLLSITIVLIPLLAVVYIFF